MSKNNQQVARENLRLTQEKFEKGVSDSVEVSQARQAVASADLDYITALFAHNLGEIEPGARARRGRRAFGSVFASEVVPAIGRHPILGSHEFHPAPVVF